MKERFKEFLRTHSDLAFVGAILLAVILVFSLSDVSNKGTVIRANSPPPQAAGQQAQAKPRAPQPLVNGPLKVSEYRPTEPALSGRLYQSMVEVKPLENGWKRSETCLSREEFEATKSVQQAATVTWPLAGRYSRVRFAVEMPRPSGNLAEYGETVIEVYRDGTKVFERRVSPSALITSPVQVDADLTGAQTLALRVALTPTGAKWDGTGGTVTWGRPFTLWLVNLEFVPAEGGSGDGQNG